MLKSLAQHFGRRAEEAAVAAQQSAAAAEQAVSAPRQITAPPVYAAPTPEAPPAPSYNPTFAETRAPGPVFEAPAVAGPEPVAMVVPEPEVAETTPAPVVAARPVAQPTPVVTAGGGMWLARKRPGEVRVVPTVMPKR